MDLTFRINKRSLLAFLCILDLMLFPYIRFLSCSLSMLLLLAWYLGNVTYLFERKGLICAVVLVAVSLIIGYCSYNNLLGLSAGVIFIFSFMLCFFLEFQYFKDGNLIEIFRKLLEVYLFTALIFAILYIVNPGLYFRLRSFWTMSGAVIEFVERSHNRFTFLFSDPNNAGCMFVAIMAYLVLFGSRDGKKQLFYLAVGSLCAIITFSVTALVMLMIICFFLLSINSRNKQWIFGTMVFIVSLCVICVLIIYTGLAESIMSSEMVRSFLWRINANIGGGFTLGGRTDYWNLTISEAARWYNFIVGKGAVVDSFGVQYSPHSLHLYIFVSFGFIANILFYAKLCYLGRGVKLRNYIPLLPCFAIFTINTGLIDYRFMAVYTSLFASIYFISKAEKIAIQEDCLS